MLFKYQGKYGKELRYLNIIQLLPLCEGIMTICSPEEGNVTRGVTWTVEGKQNVILSLYMGNTYFFIQNFYNCNCTDSNDVTTR